MDYVGEAVVAQRVGHKFHTGAMDGGVHNLEVGVTLNYLGVEAEAFDFLEEGIIDFFAYNLNLVGVALEFNLVDVGDTVYVINDVYVVRGNNLSTVGPVCLVSVVFLGVVRCSDVDTALASEVADGVRQFGSGAEAVEEVNLYAVGREYVCYYFGELARVVTHIVTYCNADFGQVFECFL